MRIIAEQDSSTRWTAWWEDAPEETVQSASMFGAVARLLLQSPGRRVAASDLIPDGLAYEAGHVEMIFARPRADLVYDPESNKEGGIR